MIKAPNNPNQYVASKTIALAIIHGLKTTGLSESEITFLLMQIIETAKMESDNETLYALSIN